MTPFTQGGTRSLRQRLRALLERNERDRLAFPGGWRSAVREVYAQYADADRAGSDARRRFWRKHEDAAATDPPTANPGPSAPRPPQSPILDRE